MTGDLQSCEDLSQNVVQGITTMIPLYEKMDACLTSSKVDCDVRLNDRITLEEVVNAHMRNLSIVGMIEENAWFSKLDALRNRCQLVADQSNMSEFTDVSLHRAKSDMLVDVVLSEFTDANDVVIDDVDEVKALVVSPDTDSFLFRIIACSLLTLCLGTVWVLLVAIYSETYFEVIDNDERAIQCQSQNYANLITNWLVQDLFNTVGRAKQLLTSGSTTIDFSGSAVSGTFGATLMSMMNTSSPVVGVYGSAFAIWKAQVCNATH